MGRKSAYRQLVGEVWTSGIYHPSPRPSDSLQTDTAGTWNHWTMDSVQWRLCGPPEDILWVSTVSRADFWIDGLIWKEDFDNIRSLPDF